MPIRRVHEYHSCNDHDCYVCNGGLASCTVCHGGEIELALDCPGRPLTDEERKGITDGTLQYYWERWWRSEDRKVVDLIPEEGAPAVSVVSGDLKYPKGGFPPPQKVSVFDPDMPISLERIPSASYQSRVNAWMLECMGSEVAENLDERSWRVAEECCELLQATGFPLESLLAMAKHVYEKNAGKENYVAVELGDLVFCLAAMANAYHIDMIETMNWIVDRNWLNLEEIRRKHAAKKLRSKAEVKVGESS